MISNDFTDEYMSLERKQVKGCQQKNYVIEIKKEFMPRKEKIYLLSREERGEMHEFIKEQLRKGYIRLSKLPQTAPVFFIGKKDGKKRMVQDYWYLNK